MTLRWWDTNTTEIEGKMALAIILNILKFSQLRPLFLCFRAIGFQAWGPIWVHFNFFHQYLHFFHSLLWSSPLWKFPSNYALNESHPSAQPRCSAQREALGKHNNEEALADIEDKYCMLKKCYWWLLNLIIASRCALCYDPCRWMIWWKLILDDLV